MMLTELLAHTPRWVFALFFALLGLGISRLFTRRTSLQRIALAPLPVVALGLFGLTSAPTTQPWALLAWGVAAAATAFWLRSGEPPAGTRYDPAKREVTIPGSVVPLAMLMGIFAIRYVAGAMRAVDPHLAALATFGLLLGAAYGALSGAIIGRTWRLWRFARAPAIAE